MKKKLSKIGLFFLILLFIFPSYSKALEKQFNFNPEVIVKSQKEAKYAPGELILKFKKGQKPQGENPAASGMASIDVPSKKNGAYKIEPIFKNHQNDELGQFYKIKLPKTINLKKAQAEFENSGNVEKASLNYFAHSTYTPNDPNYASQWALSKINMPSAWDKTLGSSSVVIANIDSGVDTDHPDIADKIWANPDEMGSTLEEGPAPNCTSRGLVLDKSCNNLDDDGNGYIDDWRGWDFVAFDYPNDPDPPVDPPNCYYHARQVPEVPGHPEIDNKTADNDPNPEPNNFDEDCNGYNDDGVDHGTATAGIAAATTNNAVGMAGVCPNCKLMAIRALDDEGYGVWDQISAGIVYAVDNGADVLSMSLASWPGYPEGPGTVLNDAIHYAYIHNKVIVAAAGNENTNLDDYPLSPACNDDFEYQYGGENQVIGVGATTSSDVKASFSNYGKTCVDISAPGTGIYTLANDGGYFAGTFGGTSAATPFVVGVAGLVKSQNPTWDNKAIRDATIDLIHNINALNPSYSGTLGGRLDANRALDSNERLHGSGAAIKGSGPAIYLLQNGYKRHILSVEIFISYYRSWDYYANIPDSRLDDYPNGPDLIFRQGTLTKAPGYSEVYQIEYPSSSKRHITSQDVFLGLSYGWDDIVGADISYINFHPSGNDINSLGSHVAGALVKTASAPEVYLLDMEGGVKTKRHVINPDIFNHYFRWQDIAIINDVELNSYADGTDYHFQDGTLLKGSGPEIYAISYGKKRHITSADAYLARGYAWGQSILVSAEELNSYITGSDLN